MILLCNLHDPVHLTRIAEDGYGHNGLCVFVHHFADGIRIDVHAFINIRKYRNGSRAYDSSR